MLRYLFLGSLLLLQSCEGNNFSAQSQPNQESHKKPESNDQVDIGSPEQNIQDEVKAQSVESRDETILKLCSDTPEYDPEQIACSLPYNYSVWQNESWKGAVAHFVASGADTEAKWISAQSGCTELPQDKLVYVSHFTLATNGHVNIDLLNDNQGRIRLWKNADMNEEVFNVTTLNEKHNLYTPQLNAGFYTVVIESTDLGEYSAIIASFKHDNKTLRLSNDNPEEWCIFRVSNTTNVADYVTRNGACRPCMTGTR